MMDGLVVCLVFPLFPLGCSSHHHVHVLRHWQSQMRVCSPSCLSDRPSPLEMRGDQTPSGSARRVAPEPSTGGDGNCVIG